MPMESMIIPIFILITTYAMTKTHTINNLILIEYLVMSSIVLMFMMTKMMYLHNHLIIYFVILMITESIVGLSLLISMIRTHGNDFIKSSLILKF